MTQPTIGTIIHVSLPSDYRAHAGTCRPALVCEVVSDTYIYAHLFVSPSDLAEMPLIDAHTRVPHWAGCHNPKRLPDSWHYAEECSDAMEREHKSESQEQQEPVRLIRAMRRELAYSAQDAQDLMDRMKEQPGVREIARASIAILTARTALHDALGEIGRAAYQEVEDEQS